MKRIVISCSLAPHAMPMVARAIAFARQIEAQIYFCHVSSDEPAVRSQINLLLGDLGVNDPQLTLRCGRPDKIIRRFAKEVGADLIIAGALEHESSLVGIFGSVARRLVRKAPCSVLLLTPDFLLSQGEIKKVLVSVNYNSNGKAMTHMAIDLCRRFQAQMRIVHPYDFCLKFLELEEIGDEKRIASYEQECKAVEMQRLNDFIESFDWQGVKVRGECLKGVEGSELSGYVHRIGIDLAVIEAPKRIYFWQRFFNPPAEVVLQDLPCPTLFFRRR